MVQSYTQRFFAILTLLKEETDADHPMDAQDIAKALESKYNISMDPRSIIRAVEEIRKADYPVEDGWYYRAELTREELIYLSDLAAMSTGLTESARRSLLKKLDTMGGRYFSPAEPNEIDCVGNDNFLNTLLTIHESIASGCRVCFHYGNYDVDGKLALQAEQSTPR